jgi:hypothetical protein
MSSCELEGWPKEIAQLDDFCPERKVICDWASRLSEGTAIGEVEYPYIPGCGAFPVYMLVEPFTAQNNADGALLASYEKAVITVRYSTKGISSGGGGALISESISPSDGIAGASVLSMYYATSGEALAPASRPFIHHGGCVFQHTRFRLSSVPPALLTNVNCVNRTVMSSSILGVTFAAESLRTAVPNISRAWTTSGITTFTVVQQFHFRYAGGKGWNSVYDPTTGLFDYVKDKSGNRIREYPLGTLILL